MAVEEEGVEVEVEEVVRGHVEGSGGVLACAVLMPNS